MNKLILIFLLFTANSVTANGIDEYHAKAEEGDPSAHYFLGMTYAAGATVDQDLSKAVYHYRKASNSEHPLSVLNLANHYWLGAGVPTDKPMAYKLFKKAHKLGVPEASKALGAIYYHGEVVDKDVSKALEFYSHTKDSDPESLLSYIDVIEKHFPDRKSEVIPLLNEAVKNAHPGIIYKLGQIYYYGDLVKRDLVSAYAWIDIATIMGHEQAKAASTIVSSKLTKDQMKNAQSLSREIRRIHFPDKFQESGI